MSNIFADWRIQLYNKYKKRLITVHFIYITILCIMTAMFIFILTNGIKDKSISGTLILIFAMASYVLKCYIESVKYTREKINEIKPSLFTFITEK